MAEQEQASEQAAIKGSHGGRPPPPVETRWKPGQSGNPSGRPKTKLVTDELRAALEANGRESLREMVRGLVSDLARNPELRQKLLPEILNRLEGKVADELIAQVEQRVKVIALRPGVETEPAPAISEGDNYLPTTSVEDAQNAGQ